MLLCPALPQGNRVAAAQEGDLSLLLSTGGQIGEKLVLQVARQQQVQQGSDSDEDMGAEEAGGQQGAAAGQLRLQVGLAVGLRRAGLLRCCLGQAGSAGAGGVQCHAA